MTKPTLYLMVGYPGSGKTTVSRLIHKITGAEHLWADKERKARFEKPTHKHNENLKLYAALNREAEAELKAGKSLIFDTNFSFRKDRDKLRRIATKAGAETKIIWVQTPRPIAKTRATEESHGQAIRVWGNMSEADFDRMADHLQPPEPDEQPIIIHGIDVDEHRVRVALRQL